MKKNIKIKSILNIIVVVMIVLIFGYLCLSENGLADLLMNAKNFKKSWLLMAVGCHFTNMLVDVILVYRFISSSVSTFTFKDAFKVSMIGQFFSAVTPSATGGQPMQIYQMSTNKIKTGSATATLTQKFLVYQTVLTVFGIIAMSIKSRYLFSLDSFIWGFTVLGFLAQAIVICALILFSFNEKFTHKVIVFLFTLLSKIKVIRDPHNKIIKLESSLNLFHKGNNSLYKNKSLVLETYILTIIQQIFFFLIPYCIFRSFDLTIEARLIDMVCAQIFINMVSWVIPLPGASGGAEAASAVFLSPFFNSFTIKSAVVITRLISYYLTIIISAPFSRISGVKKNKEGIR